MSSILVIYQPNRGPNERKYIRIENFLTLSNFLSNNSIRIMTDFWYRFLVSEMRAEKSTR